MRAGVLAEPVLVGREREIAELMRNLDLAFEGKGTAAFVSGEAGSGKTRLINEFLSNVKEKGIAVLSGWCLSNMAAPYFPFIEAFNGYFSAKKNEKAANTQQYQGHARAKEAEQTEDEEAEIKAWLSGPKQAEKSGNLQNLAPQGWKDLFVAAVTKTLLSISARQAVILFVDDLQWADSASLLLLHYISRSIRSARILVLATYRSEELGPDAEGHPHPLLETLRLMRREDLFTEIKLASLDQSSVAALAEKMVGGSLHSDLADTLVEESGGNPLFIVESLRMLSEQGGLVQDQGRWRLSIDEVGIPTKIKDIILRRVSLLKPSQRRILDLASVIGHRFDVDLLGDVLGQDSLDVLETLNAVGQSSSLVSCEGSFFEFDHAKSREAIYEEISAPLRRGYHARIAEKLELKGKAAKDLSVGDLAYHYSQAGNKEKAVKYSLAAGDDALARFGNAEAMRHFAYVLEATSEASDYVGERTKALEGYGDALSANGLFVEAMKTFEQLSNVAESGVVRLRAMRKAIGCSHWLRDPARSLELATKANQFAEFDRLEYARLRMSEAAIAKENLEDVEGALKVFEEEYSLPDVASALAEIVFLYMNEDRLEDELAAGLRSVTLYREMEDLRGELHALSRLGFAFGLVGFPQANDIVEKALKIAEKVGDSNLISILLSNRSSHLELTVGDNKEAVAPMLKAAGYAEKTESYYALANCYSSLVRLYVKLGEIDHAEESSKKIDKLFDQVAILRNNAELAGNIRHNEAFLLVAKGQWKEANEIFEEFLDPSSKTSFWGLYGSVIRAYRKTGYAWALEKQGRTLEAKMQLEEARKMREQLTKGLEGANVQAYLMARREIGVDEELNVRLDLVNVAKNPALLVRVEGLIPPGFKASALPSYCTMQNGSLEMNERKLNPFEVEPAKLNLQASKAGVFTLNPQVVYVDDVGETKTCSPRSVTVTVRPMLHAKIGEETISVPILPNRISTGFGALDALLFGGIPENYSVALASSLTDERELLIKRFLEEGAKTGETTFCITTEAGNTKVLAEKYPSNFCLFLCNLQADAMIQNLPNVFKLKGVENLTDIDIALIRAYRGLNLSTTTPKRICIEIVSDALLQHHVVTTRRWLSAILPTLKSKGFTVLAVVDPRMHPAEEIQAILGVFDGEIRISEKETPQGAMQTLRIRRLYNQKYLENEIVLTKERLSE